MDAEAAFLEAQNQEYDPAADFSFAPEETPADDDEYDPASAFTNPADGDVRSPSAQAVSIADESNANAPQATDSTLKPQPTDAAAAPLQAKKPRTKGGFVDESEDDEEEMPVAKPKSGSSLLNASGVAESPQRSVTLSPNNTHAPQAMPSISAQDQAAHGVQFPSVAATDAASSSLTSAAVPNGGTSALDTNKTAAQNLGVPVARSSAPITPVPTSLPKPRLPQDKVGIFEDRIAEDPRGDMEAWLGLIDEHRKRHKFDEAREVFQRFFQVFPAAVSQPNTMPCVSTNIGRASNGLNT